MNHDSEPFVVLLHHPGKSSRHDQVHLDWMFRQDNVLRTFATEVFDFDSLTETIEREATSLPDHRIAYLEYEGLVSGDRGEVQRVASGSFLAQNRSDDRFAVHLTWQTVLDAKTSDNADSATRSAELTFYRSFESDGRLSDAWRLRLSPCR